MEDKVRQYVGLPYSIFVVPDVTTDNEPCYLAYHPDLEGCMSHGTTPEEALRNLEEVTELYVATLLGKGIEPPEPGGLKIAWDVATPTTGVEAHVQYPPTIEQRDFAPSVA